MLLISFGLFNEMPTYNSNIIAVIIKQSLVSSQLVSFLMVTYNPIKFGLKWNNCVISVYRSLTIFF